MADPVHAQGRRHRVALVVAAGLAHGAVVLARNLQYPLDQELGPRRHLDPAEGSGDHVDRFAAHSPRHGQLVHPGPRAQGRAEQGDRFEAQYHCDARRSPVVASR